LAASPIDYSDIEAHVVHVPSKDGTEVPLSLIHRKGLRHDGTNATLFVAYGAYGLTIEPAFLPTMRVWYDRGGIFPSRTFGVVESTARPDIESDRTQQAKQHR
jgi:protease II